MIALTKRIAIAAAFLTTASLPALANNDQQNEYNIHGTNTRLDNLFDSVQQSSDWQGQASEIILGPFIKGYNQGSETSRSIIEKNLRTPPKP